MIGDEGEIVDRAFAERLALLRPSLRRLALAMACTEPWRRSDKLAPKCFQRSLLVAAADAREEVADRASEDGDPIQLVEAVLRDFTSPLPLSVLRDLAEETPSRRRVGLINSICAVWKDESEIPACYRREFDLASAEAHEEYMVSVSD